MESQPLLSGRRQAAVSHVELADAPDLLGFRVYHLYVGLLAFLFIGCGSAMVSPVPFVLEPIMQEYSIGKGTVALVQSCYTFGSFIGAYLMGMLADRLGRKKCSMFCTFATIVIASLHLFTPSGYVGLIVLFSLRVCGGVQFSGFSLLKPIVLFEYVPNDWRITALAITGLGWNAAFLSITVSLLFFEMQWRFVLSIFAIIWGVITLGAICLMHETPRWLFVNGYHQEGYRILQRILDSTLLSGQDCGLTTPPQVIVPKQSKERTIWETFPTLFNTDLRRATCVGCLMWISTSGNTYAFGLWLPTLLKEISGAARIDYMLFILADICSAAIGTILSIWANDRLGRKISYTVTAILMAVLQAVVFIFASQHKRMFVLALLVSHGVCSTINWTTMIAMVPEMYPTTLRASAAGFCMAPGRISAAIIPVAVGMTLEVSTFGGVIVMVVTILVGALAAPFARETANKSLEDEV